jgi:sensor c-di-GMP phosphodiesterase-like protein
MLQGDGWRSAWHAAACLAILLDLKRQSLESQLRRAICSGTLSLVYQPIVDLRKESVVGAEALIRWTKRNGDSVSPEVFIALAEEKRFVGHITRFVLRRVVDEFGDMLAQGRLHITMNLTVQDLADPNFLPELNRCLGSANINSAAIGLELTERSTADPVIARNALLKLRQAGYTIYIDDFGTGYSSLAYLHQLSVNGIKVDQMFTNTAGTGSVTASVIPQIISMAEQLGLKMII